MSLYSPPHACSLRSHFHAAPAAPRHRPRIRRRFPRPAPENLGAPHPPHAHRSNHKKVAFLREAARAITLTNIDVFAGRAEDFPSTADVVTLRAVERFDSILPIAIRLLSPAGRLALLIGSSQLSRAQSHFLHWQTPVPLPDSTARCLLIGNRPKEPN